MGFFRKLKRKLTGDPEPEPVTTPAESTPPPTVADTQPQDVRADYEQQAARRRGLLSTILSDSNRRNAPLATTGATGNTTLG